MARGIFGRIGRAIRDFVAPPQPQPSREPPPEEPTSRDFRQVWRNERGQGSYRKNLRAFHKVVDPVEPDPAGQLELWETYIRNINRSGPVRRQSINNPFWLDSGIDPSNFDWDAWREAMGFTGRRRSRTP